jgi:three-Cys-motif partner protein
MKDHSKAKVKLLGEYLTRYLNVISNDGYTTDIFIHDMFSGPGIYEDGGNGSPAVILEKIKEAYSSNTSRGVDMPNIHCRFNDKDSNNVKRLKDNIQAKSLHSSNFGKIEYTNFDYEAEVSNLAEGIKHLKSQKAFIFIDPYGYSMIRPEPIKELLQNRKTEVLLWLPIQQMYRFSEKGTPAHLEELLVQLGIDATSASGNIWGFTRSIKEGFQRFMGDELFVDYFSIKKDEGTVYCLYFFTPHIRGFEKMLEAKWEIDSEAGHGWVYNSQPTLFSAQKTNPLEEALKKYLASDSVKYNGDIYKFTLNQGFLPKHTNQVFKALQDSGSLDVRHPDGSAPKSHAFYVHYDTYKNDYKKVLFRLKH